MNECANDIRINSLPQKGRVCIHPTILYMRTVPVCTETKCKPYFDTLNRILSFSWHNKFHSTSGKTKSIRKSQNIVWEKDHTYTRMHWNWIQTNSILVILCLDGEEHSINGIAISVKMVADWSTIFFLSTAGSRWMLCRNTCSRWFSIMCFSLYCYSNKFDTLVGIFSTIFSFDWEKSMAM